MNIIRDWINNYSFVLNRNLRLNIFIRYFSLCVCVCVMVLVGVCGGGGGGGRGGGGGGEWVHAQSIYTIPYQLHFLL